MIGARYWCPGNQQVEELVQAGDDRQHREAPVQDLVGLVSRIAGLYRDDDRRVDSGDTPTLES